MILVKLLKKEYEISDGTFKILCDVENGLLTVTTPQGKPFSFINSNPEIVRAIGRMLLFIGESRGLIGGEFK